MKRYKEFVVENLNYARSVLRKKGIDDKDPNFIKLREICKDKMGYLGVLTKLVYVDGTPMDEITDIFNSLVEFNINAGEALPLSYVEISDLLADKRLGIKADTGFKFEFTDGVYNYYRAFSAEGIQNLGSPAWCIKSKNHFDDYTNGDPQKNHQWVVIKKMNKKLIVPNTNYFKKYVNTDNPFIRIGITINETTGKIQSFDDNNTKVDLDDGPGKLVYDNIQKFIKFGKIEKDKIEDIIKTQPIITFDGHKKIFEVREFKKRDFDKIDAYFGNIKGNRPDNFSANYLFVSGDEFISYVDIQTVWIAEYDNQYVLDKSPYINTKFYLEITKYLLDKNEYLPNILVPHGMNIGVITNDILKDKELTFIKTHKENSFFVEIYFNKNDFMFIELVILDVTQVNVGSMSHFLIRVGHKNGLPETQSGVVGYTGSKREEYRPTQANVKIISEYFGNVFTESINRYRKYNERISGEKRKKEAEERAKLAAEKRIADEKARVEFEKRRKEEEVQRKIREERERKIREELERIAEVQRKKKEEEERIEREKKPWNKFKKWAWGDD